MGRLLQPGAETVTGVRVTWQYPDASDLNSHVQTHHSPGCSVRDDADSCAWRKDDVMA